MSDSCVVSGVIFRACRVWILYPEQRASCMQSFKVNSFQVSLSVGVHDPSSFKTVFTSHVLICFGKVGLFSKSPFISLFTKTFCPNGAPSNRLRKQLSAQLLCCMMHCCQPAKRGNSQLLGQTFGLEPLALAHFQPTTWFHLSLCQKASWVFPSLLSFLPERGFYLVPRSGNTVGLRGQRGNLIPSDQCRKPPLWS